MTEFQKIAVGLLGLTHPETQHLRSRNSTLQHSELPAQHPDQQPQPGALLRAAKFAFAALLAGSRAIPLGDNSCVTRELSAYGARMQLH